MNDIAEIVGYMTLVFAACLFLFLLWRVAKAFFNWKFPFRDRLSLCWWILTNKKCSSRRYNGKLIVEVEMAHHVAPLYGDEYDH